MDQYKTFIGLLPEIERVLAAKGIDVPRPQYDVKSIARSESKEEEGRDEGAEGESSKAKKKATKPNHEATSDEDEE